MSVPSYDTGIMPGKTKAAVVILWIGAALGVVLGLIAMAAFGSIGTPGGTFTFLLALLFVGAILNAVFAVAIQNRRNWARITAIVLCSIGGAGQVFSLISGDASALLGLAINIAVIVLLASQESKEWCRG